MDSFCPFWGSLARFVLRLVYGFIDCIFWIFSIPLSLLDSVRGAKATRFYLKVFGNVMNCHKDILERLHIRNQDLVSSEDQSDVFIGFVSISSRAGTDIEAALKNVPKNRPVVLVVLHHTFDENCIVPESSRTVYWSNIRVVDFLFHEDRGILNCPQNTKALAAIQKSLQDTHQKWNQKWRQF